MGQPSSAHAIPVNDNDALSDVIIAQSSQDFIQPPDHICLAPIAIPKQNEARLGGSSERK
jgi:hypothetical protein